VEEFEVATGGGFWVATGDVLSDKLVLRAKIAIKAHLIGASFADNGVDADGANTALVE
jgi:hypothetical protein